MATSAGSFGGGGNGPPGPRRPNNAGDQCPSKKRKFADAVDTALMVEEADQMREERVQLSRISANSVIFQPRHKEPSVLETPSGSVNWYAPNPDRADANGYYMKSLTDRESLQAAFNTAEFLGRRLSAGRVNLCLEFEQPRTTENHTAQIAKLVRKSIQKRAHTAPRQATGPVNGQNDALQPPSKQNDASHPPIDEIKEWPLSNSYAKNLPALKPEEILDSKLHCKKWDATVHSTTDLPPDPMFEGKTIHDGLLGSDRFVAQSFRENLVNAPSEADKRRAVTAALADFGLLDSNGRPIPPTPAISDRLSVKVEPDADGENTSMSGLTESSHQAASESGPTIKNSQAQADMASSDSVVSGSAATQSNAAPQFHFFRLRFGAELRDRVRQYYMNPPASAAPSQDSELNDHLAMICGIAEERQKRRDAAKNSAGQPAGSRDK